jgi:alpha-D-xyloside xylohydrolase
MRAMFYEFPEDERCWKLQDQYMFGDKYLVAPVLNPSQENRTVYLPNGKWKHIFTGAEYEGGTTVTVDTPIENIPVFEKL